MIKTTFNPAREIHRSFVIRFAALISLLTLAIQPAKSQSYDFSSSNHGFVPATGGTSPNKSPFVYADGIWTTQGAESGSAQHSIATLTSPSIDASGRTEIEIKHSYNFEENWDTGHLVLIINGTEQRAGVDIGEFADGGYEGLLPEQGSNPEQGNFVWTGMSSEAGVSRLVIEDVEVGSTLSLKFVATWDEATLTPSPNWIIERVNVVTGGETPPATTWVVDRDPNNAAASFSDLQTAVDSVKAGDTIILMPSSQSYGHATIDKGITIMGAGFGGAELHSLTRHKESITGVITLIDGASNLALIGLSIHSVSVGKNDIAALSNILIIRNIFHQDHGSLRFDGKSRINNLSIINNWIESHVFCGTLAIIENAVISNNVFHHSFTWAPAAQTPGNVHAIVVNNIFLSTSSFSMQAGVFSGNIIQRKAYEDWRSGYTEIDHASQSGNVYAGAAPWSGEGVPIDLAEHDVFTKTLSDVVTLSGDWWEQYVLTAKSPAKGITENGGDAGIFGGLHPWDTEQMPPFPFVSMLVAPNVVTQGQPFTVELEVQTNN